MACGMGSFSYQFNYGRMEADAFKSGPCIEGFGTSVSPTVKDGIVNWCTTLVDIGKLRQTLDIQIDDQGPYYLPACGDGTILKLANWSQNTDFHFFLISISFQAQNPTTLVN
jgi:hypothetical protein